MAFGERGLGLVVAGRTGRREGEGRGAWPGRAIRSTFGACVLRFRAASSGAPPYVTLTE